MLTSYIRADKQRLLFNPFLSTVPCTLFCIVYTSMTSTTDLLHRCICWVMIGQSCWGEDWKVCNSALDANFWWTRQNFQKPEVKEPISPPHLTHPWRVRRSKVLASTLTLRWALFYHTANSLKPGVRKKTSWLKEHNTPFHLSMRVLQWMASQSFRFHLTSQIQEM